MSARFDGGSADPPALTAASRFCYISGVNRSDRLVLAALVVLAAAIWLTDRRWDPGDHGVVVVCLPVFAMLVGPWRFKPASRLPLWPFALALAGMVAGWYVHLMVVEVAAWNLALWSWLSRRLEDDTLQRAVRLSPLPALAFPWIPLDCEGLIWGLRVFGAWSMEQVLVLMDVAVTRAQTTVMTPYGSFQIIKQCAGINTLQSMTIVGTILCYMNLRKRATYWPYFFLIVGIAVLTNSIRIVAIGLVGIFVGIQYTEGAIHTWLGWIVVMAVFMLLFDFLSEPRVRVRPFRVPSLEEWKPLSGRIP
jgi:exosortase